MKKSILVGITLLVLFIILISCGEDKIINSESFFQVTTYKTFGGSNWEWGREIIPSTDGGNIIVGWTDSYGEGRNSLYLIRTDTNGDAIWDEHFGGAKDDYGEAVTLTNDGGILAVGGSNSFGGVYQKYLVKTDMDGNLDWQKTLGPTTYESPSSVFLVDDGYIIGGQVTGSSNDFQLIKIDFDGVIDWENTYTTSEEESFHSMISTGDNGYLLTGYRYIIGTSQSRQGYMLKVNSDGVKQWDKAFGDVDLREEIYSAVETTNNDIIAVGTQTTYSTTELPVSRLYVVKYREDGTLAWENVYDIELNPGGIDIVEQDDGSLIICGSSTELWGISLTKLDQNGTLAWNHSTNVEGIPYDMIHGAEGFLMTGSAPDPVNGSGLDNVLLLEVKER